jgi:hypothetical protein
VRSLRWVGRRILNRSWASLTVCAMLEFALILGRPGGSLQVVGDLVLAAVLLGVAGELVIALSAAVLLVAVVLRTVIGDVSVVAGAVEVALPLLGVGGVLILVRTAGDGQSASTS